MLSVCSPRARGISEAVIVPCPNYQQQLVWTSLFFMWDLDQEIGERGKLWRFVLSGCFSCWQQESARQFGTLVTSVSDVFSNCLQLGMLVAFGEQDPLCKHLLLVVQQTYIVWLWKERNLILLYLIYCCLQQIQFFSDNICMNLELYCRHKCGVYCAHAIACKRNDVYSRKCAKTFVFVSRLTNFLYIALIKIVSIISEHLLHLYRLQSSIASLSCSPCLLFLQHLESEFCNLKMTHVPSN